MSSPKDKERKVKKPNRTRAICKKCGVKFSYKPLIQGLTRNTCDDCQPKLYAQ